MQIGRVCRIGALLLPRTPRSSCPDLPAPVEAPDEAPVEAIACRLRAPEGKKLYGLRKQTPEPDFGIIKSVMSFRQFRCGASTRFRASGLDDHGPEREADVHLERAGLKPGRMPWALKLRPLRPVDCAVTSRRAVTPLRARTPLRASTPLRAITPLSG